MNVDLCDRVQEGNKVLRPVVQSDCLNRAERVFDTVDETLEDVRSASGDPL